MTQDARLTLNLTPFNADLAALKKHFPQCFDAQGDFILEKFQHLLQVQAVNFSKESYGLDWLGKSYARLLACDPATTLLKPDPAHNAKPQNAASNNLLLKGDNLEVLKHLSHAYHEQVKMIYIDPPYNTGSDGFVYQDDRKFSVKELQQLAGVDAEKAQRILAFTQSKSNSHSAWLTFMYPRLYIAKQLLKEDGVIFVSIDDNEVAQLRLLMDEIFGEENYLKEIAWNSTKSVTNTAIISDNHSYILIYAKNLGFQVANREDFRLPEDDVGGFSNPDNDPRGPWKADPFQVGGWRPNQQYEITNPNTGKIYKPNDGNSWKNDDEKFNFLLKDKRIVFGVTGEAGPQRKRFLFEAQARGKVSKSLWDNDGTTTEGTQEVKKLFDELPVFTNPKPVKLLKKIIALGSNPSDLILDFFAGSGTTGDAVMQLNAEDGGNRQFILVQIPEAIDPKKSKTAYDFVKTLHAQALITPSAHADTPPQEGNGEAAPTIFDITKERLIRAAAKTQEKHPQAQGDFGFKVFETMPIWDDYAFDADTFNPNQALFDTKQLTEDDIKALLMTWKTHDGMMLTQNLAEITLGDYSAYYGNGKLYLMHQGFNTTHLKILLEKIDRDAAFQPTVIIAFAYYFESKNLRELAENLTSYANKKHIDIDFVTRY